MKNILTLENVSITIDKKEILKDVTFTVNSHDFIFLTGNNGSGKSSLLNVIAQDYRRHPYVNGEILYNGNINFQDYDVLSKKNTSWYKKEICYLRQDQLFTGSIFNYFYCIMDPIKENEKEIKRLPSIINDIQEFLGLDKKIITQQDVLDLFIENDFLLERIKENNGKKFLNQSINENLSGGEKKIVEILAAIMRAKNDSIKLLLIDEPFNHLDVKNIKRAVQLILSLRKLNPDLAIIVTTHCMAFPTPCSGVTDAIEEEYFKHYVISEGILRNAYGNEKYEQGKCFINI